MSTVDPATPPPTRPAGAWWSRSCPSRRVPDGAAAAGAARRSAPRRRSRPEGAHGRRGAARRRRRRTGPGRRRRPRPRPPSSRARCEIDLSPGTAHGADAGAGPRRPQTTVPRSCAGFRTVVRAAGSRPSGPGRAAPRRSRRRRRRPPGPARHASPSALWAISRSAMFTPRSPARVVISASTPGRSGTGTRISVRRSGRTAQRRERRAAPAAARVEHLEQAGRGRPGHPVAHGARGRLEQARRRRARWPAALSAQTSGQMAGCPAAIRVMSRKPPAASRSRAACSSACGRPGS